MERNDLETRVRQAIGQRTRKLREGLGLSVRDMAPTLSLTMQGLYKLERGSIFVGPRVLLELRRHGLDLNTMLDEVMLEHLRAENDNHPDGSPRARKQRLKTLARGRQRVE